MPKVFAEGTLVRILRYDKRPEFSDKEAEIGNFSEKDNTYECWLTDDALEGNFALCDPADIELVVKKPTPPPCGTIFGPGDRVKGKESGNLGTVESVDDDGDPKVKMDGEEEAQQRFGSEFEVVETASFGIGDRVKGKDSGKIGTVTDLDDDGDPKVKLDGEDEAKQRFGKEFEVIEKAKFAIGDRVQGRDSGKNGTVVSVDEDGDPSVKLDGEDEAKQRFGKEFKIIEKRAPSRSRSKSGGKKKKKKKEKSSSSSSSSSSSRRKRSNTRSKSRRRQQKNKSAFGRSTMEQREDDKRRARKFAKKHGAGADAALSLLGLR